MKNNPIYGAMLLPRGLKAIMTPGLRRYTLIPALLNVIVFGLMVYFSGSYIDDWVARLLPSWLSWLGTVLKPILYLTVGIVALVIAMLLANIIAAPFNALLAEKLEAHLRGKPIDNSGGISTVLKNIPRTMGSELRKLTYFLLRALPILLLFIIPVVNVIAPILWFVFSAWFMAIEFLDYPMGNHNKTFPEQREKLRSMRATGLGYGSGVLLLSTIPLLNFIIIPAAVAGATVLWVESDG